MRRLIIMKSHRKQTQREEVRSILHAMRLELAAQSLVQSHQQEVGQSRSVLDIGEVINNSKKLVAS